MTGRQTSPAGGGPADDEPEAATVVDRGDPPRLSAPPEDPIPAVAGYELIRALGRGGMGIVWEALELKLGRLVALKVHRSASPTNDGLWTEAFVAARIGDPSIVRVLDIGFTLDERPYYAMELVHGTDLAALIADGPLAPRHAVAIAADMARAAAAAHGLGIIHRDLKPSNVIIDGTGRARVCDFGIAFDSRRGDDPYSGLLVGSPAYMAPEQTTGGAVTPQTDIWAIGVILYEMLTGERPFAGTRREQLFERIRTAEPPPPSRRRPGVHPDLDAVVARCLRKTPADRLPGAAVLFETLSAIAEGQPIDTGPAPTYAPRPATADPGGQLQAASEQFTRHLSWSWQLRCSPAALWPYVSDTDRFNKAVGLSPVSYTQEVDPAGGVRRFGEFRIFGQLVAWREYPFEWVRDRGHSVLRVYDSGPLRALRNRVTLTPREDGGTHLTHEIWLTPRGVFGHVAAFVELDQRLSRAIDRFYRRLDELIVTGSASDPFEPPHAASAEQRAIVAAGCARLRAEGFDAALVERLAQHLLTAPGGVLATIRPYELADAWGTGRAETLDAFVHASHIGLLEPGWNIICPKCMISHDSVSHLDHVTRHGTCSGCATSFERDLRDSVELVFAAHPSVRVTEQATFCVGSPARRPHIVAQQLLAPGETRAVAMTLPRGTYRVASSLPSAPWEVVASAVGFEEGCEVTADEARIAGRPAILKAGPVTFQLTNASEAEQALRVEVGAAREDVVSAAAALTHPTFRTFFSAQLLAHGEHLRVRHLAFLFVEVVAREAMFDRLGDGIACSELARLDAMVGDAARQQEGAVVPSSLSIHVVGFPTPLRAIRAALALRRRIELEKFGAQVAIAAHDGGCIALTRAGKPEFFGQTLHRGQALLRDCPAGGIAVSASMMGDRAVAVAVHEDGALTVSVDTAGDGPYGGRRITLLRP